MTYRLAVIGGGNMGAALAGGLVATGWATPEDLVVVEVAAGRRGQLSDSPDLRGELPLVALSEAELDRIVGSLYAYVEQCFPAAIRIGFASRF